jgi:hypothetical protein
MVIKYKEETIMSQALNMQNLKTALMQNNIKMKEWVHTQTSETKAFTIEWVETLPLEDISTSAIYMLKDVTSTAENNIYVEYVYKEGHGWEILGKVDMGEVSVDLSNYYNKEEVDALIEALMEAYTEEDITTMIGEIWSE